METDFNAICEDDSTDEIGNILCTMWRECGQGDFTLVNKTLSTESKRAATIQQSQGMEGGDMIDSDDENDGASLPSGTMNSRIEEGDEAMEEVEEEEPVPLVDPDGWQTVSKPKKTTKKR